MPLPHLFRRRPGSARGAVVCGLGLALLTGCGSDAVDIDALRLSETDRKACAELLDALPQTLFGQPRRPVQPQGAPGVAWGDPAVVLTCGVPAPAGYQPTAHCSQVRGVGWYVPDEQLGDLGEEVVATALTHTPYVELRVPPERRAVGVDRALADLAPAVKGTLAEDRPCL